MHAQDIPERERRLRQLISMIMLVLVAAPLAVAQEGLSQEQIVEAFATEGPG